MGGGLFFFMYFFVVTFCRIMLKRLILLGQGPGNNEIATKRFPSPETVKKHMYNIYQKLSEVRCKKQSNGD